MYGGEVGRGRGDMRYCVERKRWVMVRCRQGAAAQESISLQSERLKRKQEAVGSRA